MSITLVLVIWIFHAINDESVIKQVFTIAGYTYGPLLGLYAFGLFTPFYPKDAWVPIVCIVAPILSYLVTTHLMPMGFELLWFNGALTFMGLMFISRRLRETIEEILPVDTSEPVELV